RILRAEYYGDVPRPLLEQARQSAKRALDLESSLSEAHLALAEVRRMLEWDWRGAEAAYTQAIVLNPSHEGAHRSYGIMLAALGRGDEAVREVERACELDPLCLVVNTSAAWVHFASGDYDAAIGRCRHTIDMDPRFFAARRLLGAALLQAGRTSEAVRAYSEAVELAPDNPVLLSWLAHAKAVSGNRAEAADIVRGLNASKGRCLVPAYHLALAHVGLGDYAAAFAELEQATVECDPALASVVIDPRFEPIRADARYARLVEL